MGRIALLFAGADAVMSLIFLLTYTDNVQIDWTSYVSQGEAVLDGILDYSQIRGPQGPIAYFAGHAYLFAFLSYTGISYNFRYSQILWTSLHIISTYVLISIAEKAITNKKLQYLCAAFYVLQFRERYYTIMFLQNDFIMVFFLQLAVYFLVKSQVMVSILMFNLALSIKVGCFMWLPGYLLILAKKRSILCPIFFVIFSFCFQYAIAYPFIQANKAAFIQNTFGTNRRLDKRTTVLYFGFSEETFLTKEFAMLAIALMLGSNALFLICKWTNWRTFLQDIRVWPLSLKLGEVQPSEVVRIIYTSVLLQATFNYQTNFQFFIWYSPVYPFLVSICKVPLELQIPMAIILEYGTLFSRSYPIVKIAASFLHVFLIFILWTKKTQDQDEQQQLITNNDKKVKNY